MADTRIVAAPIPHPGRDLLTRHDDHERDRRLYDGHRRQIAQLAAAGRDDEARHDDVGTVDDVSHDARPHADEIFRPAPIDPAKTLTREMLAIGIDMMRATTDDLAAAVLERVLGHLADVADRLAVVELELSEALAIAYQRHAMLERQREQLAHLRDLARAAR